MMTFVSVLVLYANRSPSELFKNCAAAALLTRQEHAWVIAATFGSYASAAVTSVAGQMHAFNILNCT